MILRKDAKIISLRKMYVRTCM